MAPQAPNGTAEAGRVMDPVASTLPVTFALVQPSEPGNVGAVARSLAAFGFERLVLIDPPRRNEAVEQARAVRFGLPVLERARVIGLSEVPALLAEFDEIWATSARAGRRRALVDPGVAVARYAAREPVRLLVLFGPERTGLDLEWLDRCDRLVRIPTPGGPLNLAQAVTVIAYELCAQALGGPRAAGACGPPGAASEAAASAGAGVPRRRGAPVAAEARREILARTEALLARIGYPTRSLRSHPHRAYLDPLRAGAFTREQARWLLGLIARLERALAAERGDVGAQKPQSHRD